MTASASPIAPVRPAETAPPRRPRPWIAALLTLLLPGLGHVYAGFPRRAVVAMVALYAGVVAIILLSFVAPWAVLRMALMVLLVAAPLVLLPLDAARTARAARHRAPAPRRAYQRWWALLALWIVGVFAVQGPMFGLIRARVAEAFHIPSGAMVPTILPGDVLLASPWISRPVSRGAVVIYRPVGQEERFVQRVVGVPGDTLVMRAFRLTVNGKPAPWPRAALTPGGDTAGGPDPGNWGPVVLRADEHFLLGDDYQNSLDSRHRGPMPGAAIVGQPRWVYFSRDPETRAVRWRRLGYRIR